MYWVPKCLIAAHWRKQCVRLLLRSFRESTHHFTSMGVGSLLQYIRVVIKVNPILKNVFVIVVVNNIKLFLPRNFCFLKLFCVCRKSIILFLSKLFFRVIKNLFFTYIILKVEGISNKKIISKKQIHRFARNCMRFL